MSPQALLEVEDLYKTFRVGFFRKTVRAVRGVTFEVRRGEVFGLLGPNGAGKSTTIKTAMGLIFPSKGSVRVLGRSCTQPASRHGVGYLPENPYFHESLTPRELLAFYGRLYGLDGKTIRRRSERLLEQVDLGHAAKRQLRKFSKGMLQRVGLAQALLAEPELLILDEPMSGLDPIGRKLLADMIAQLGAGGTTVVFSSHILSDVERLCSRVVILNKGRKVAEGRLEELLKKDAGTETLEDLFVRKALEVEPVENSA